MRSHVVLLGAGLFALLALSPSGVHAAESYDNCNGFIDSVPVTISRQGVWCLRKDVSTAITSGSAITIVANNVTLDCNDFKVGGFAAGVGTSTNGVSANNRLNVTVRHCNIRGFLRGASLIGNSGGGHVVEDNRFEGNTQAGIAVEGDGSTIRRNEVRGTGTSTSLTGSAVGISARSGVDIIDNTVSGVAPTPLSGNATAYGILNHSIEPASITGNRVRGLVPVGTGMAYGIYNDDSGRIILRENDVARGGNLDGVGIQCYSAQSTARDNVVSGFSAPIVNCLSDGDTIN